MKKSKFILGVLAAITISVGSIAQAGRYIAYDYTPSANGSYNDVVITFVGAATAPGSNYKEASYKGVGATGAYGTSNPCEVSPFTVVNNVTMNVNLEGAANQQYISAIANGTGIVMGDSTLTMTGGYVSQLCGGAISLSDCPPAGGYFAEAENPEKGRPFSRGNVTLNVCGTTNAETIRGGCNTSGYMSDKPIGFFTHQGNITINVYDNASVTSKIYGGGGSYCCVEGDVSINISGDSTVNRVYGGARNGRDGVGAYVNNATISISERAHITGDVFGGGSYDGQSSVVKGDTMVIIKGGTIDKNVYGGGEQDIVKGNSLVVLEGGTIAGNVYGSGMDNTTEGTATVQVLSGDWSNTSIYGKTDGATVNGGARLLIGAEGQAFTGTIGETFGFDTVEVAKGSVYTPTKGNIFDIATHTYTITSANLGTDGQAVTVLGDQVSLGIDADKQITLNLESEGRLKSGKYKVLDASASDEVDTSTNWDPNHVAVSGLGATFDSLVWDEQVLYLNYVSPAVDAAMTGNWGVFKASMAFTGTLWGNRTNACLLGKSAPAPVYPDEKGAALAAAPAPGGITLAWGTVYGQDARISGVGADYSLYGGAIGAEHLFASGRSLGAALGYDWGTVSPFGSSDIDQETLHAAVYGRAGIWQLGEKSAVALDWSAAYGNTTSENDLVGDDWSQESLQLDTRVSYLRKLSTRATGSVFAGVQYFTADSDKVDGMEVSSMQNLRAEIGAGLSYQLNQKATVYGEASLYNDLMRHNPYVTDGGQRFKGTNPGRTGGSLSVGAQYELNANWAVRGSYSFDAAEDSTEHNLNVGAMYKF